jgi:hypothetical protein
LKLLGFQKGSIVRSTVLFGLQANLAGRRRERNEALFGPESNLVAAEKWLFENGRYRT